MKTKNIIKTGLVVAGLGALAFGAKKVADDHKLMKNQEELTAIVRDYFLEIRKGSGTPFSLFLEPFCVTMLA